MTLDREAIRRQHRHPKHRAQRRRPIVVLADNIDKASNLGGILRTAEAFGVEKVLTNRQEPDVAGAMGAEHWQPVEWNVDLQQEALQYRGQGYAIIALEQSSDALPLSSFRYPERVALIVGSEMFGVSDDLLAVCDRAVYIPQAGLIKSLNVATSTAIALYEFSRQWWMPSFQQDERHLRSSSESMRIKKSPPPRSP